MQTKPNPSRLLAVVTGERGYREIVRPLEAVGATPLVLDWERLKVSSRMPHYAFPIALGRAMREVSADWIVTDMTSAFLGFICAEAREKGAKVALRLRGDLFRERQDQMMTHVRTMHLRGLASEAISYGLERIFFSEVDLYLPVSHWLQEALSPVGRSVVIGTACDVTAFTPAEHLPEDRLRVVSVTNFDYSAKTEPLVQFLEEWAGPLAAEGFTFDIAGKGIGLEAFRQRCAGLPGVRVLGYVSTGGDFYAGYGAMLHLTGLDAFPYAVLEGAASGLPVIASAVGGVREQIRDGETGYLVAAGDGVRVVELLRGLRENAALRSSLGRAGRAEVGREYSLAARGEALLGAIAGGS